MSAPVGDDTIRVDTLADGTECGFAVTVTLTPEDRSRPVGMACR